MARGSARRRRRGLDSTLDFMRVLWAVEHALETTSKRMNVRLGVTGPQRLVLRLVERFPEISAGDLARVTWLHPSTLTGVLRRLERRGLLERLTDPRDRRRVKLRIRPAARRLIGPVAGTVEVAVTRMRETVPSRHVDHARQVLTALARALDERIAEGADLPGGLAPGRTPDGP
ncbi:MAG TPA: MarR family winged helix-turn-helix transcriptional regulator [Vicinamibacterales bacterium]|nr:MarR family winged helix-turn-helix transcriptional regulator [Vicinamibacterales bacterium]